MTILDSILLGIFQGLTEFLPISSSGHLVLLQELLNIESPGVVIEVLLHIGTLISVIVYFWSDILSIIYELINIVKNKGRLANIQSNESNILIKMVVIGSIPTALIGILFESLLKKGYENVYIVGIMLLLTGLLLWWSSKLSGNKAIKDITVSDSIFIGFFQGLAINPGLSRSGSTIFASLFRGIERESAVKFSFILSLPAVCGAFLFEAKDIYKIGIANINITGCIIGIACAAISGYFAIKFLMKLLLDDKLHYFSYYCWIIGVLILLSKFI
ncbi:MAG TPA: undecaprenyl-diphosphate phosphatase [Thermoanaerobacterales bacterium]|nr:undecaprenyl-diphosphate phosphatase [Thermoanaerobacterales bacterium]